MAAMEAQNSQYLLQRALVVSRLRKHSWFGPLKSRKFLGQLKLVRSYLVAREKMREYSTRCYYLYRCYLLELGRRLSQSGALDQADDIFMLDRQELKALLSDGTRLGAWTAHEQSAWKFAPATGMKETLQLRWRFYRGYRHLEAPNEFGRGVHQRDEDSYVEEAEGRLRLKGLGCSAGIVEGTVRVLHVIDDIGSLQKGEILVTRFTDPGWTPAMGLASGLVTEVGGVLSHAAVIGRELGIPAVLNLPGAMKRLATGQRIRMNGSSGIIELLEGASL
jgi:phosphohistidine swiveling domain-containing protein